MRLRGPHLIGQANLNTSTNSQAGALPANSGVIVPLDAYTFAQAGKITIPSVFPYWGPGAFAFADPVADPDVPDWLLFNQSVDAESYSVAWRHINP